MNDYVNHPSHYCTGKFECFDVMQETQGTEAVKNFCICNAFKYLYRNRKKNGSEDVKKAIWYLNKYVELEEDVNNDDKPIPGSGFADSKPYRPKKPID